MINNTRVVRRVCVCVSVCGRIFMQRRLVNIVDVDAAYPISKLKCKSDSKRSTEDPRVPMPMSKRAEQDVQWWWEGPVEDYVVVYAYRHTGTSFPFWKV
jgi:hypothetical protein